MVVSHWWCVLGYVRVFFFFFRREHGGTWRNHDLCMGGREGGHKGTAGNTEGTHKDRKGKMKKLFRNQTCMGDPLYSLNSLFIFPLCLFCDTSIFPYVTSWSSPCEDHDLLCCPNGPFKAEQARAFGEPQPSRLRHVYVHGYTHVRIYIYIHI